MLLNHNRIQETTTAVPTMSKMSSGMTLPASKTIPAIPPKVGKKSFVRGSSKEFLALSSKVDMLASDLKQLLQAFRLSLRRHPPPKLFLQPALQEWQGRVHHVSPFLCYGDQT